MKLKLLFAFLLSLPAVSAQEKFTVFFDFDQYALNAESVARLDEWISSQKEIEVTKIYGFCDWKGSNTYNDSLSVKRVRTVSDYLRGKNIKIRKGYETRGFGEDFEQSKVQSENRKVTIAYEVRKPEIPKPTTSDDDNLPLLEKIKEAKVGQKIKLNDLLFFNMTPRVLPRSKTLLFELLCAMQDNPKLKIEIQGHICCQTNGDQTNLSTARAKAVYNFLISNKINRNRLSFKGFGTSYPIYPIPEKDEKEENANRRVELLIVEN